MSWLTALITKSRLWNWRSIFIRTLWLTKISYAVTRGSEKRGVEDRGGAGQLRFGGRNCPKLVRCYFKRQINRYRVELESSLARFLRKQEINNIADLARVANVVYPAHIAFKIMKWKKLEAHLQRRYGKVRAAGLIDQARECAEISPRKVTRFLSKSVYNCPSFLGLAGHQPLPPAGAQALGFPFRCDWERGGVLFQ